MTRSSRIPLFTLTLVALVSGAALLLSLPPSHAVAIATCNESDAPDACFDVLVSDAYRQGGLQSAFELIGNIADASPSFSVNCHGNAHELGRLSYEDWRAAGEVDFTPRAAYCGYGFYHGFMEALLADSGDAKKGRELCEHLGAAFEEESVDADGACYHGIGHGAVDGTDVGNWGNPDAMIRSALSLCEQVMAGLPVTPTGPLYRCTTGAYNALEILSQSEKYRLTELASNPFSFCARQKATYRQGCNTNMIPALMRLVRDDFIAATDSITALTQVGIDRESLVTDLFHEYIRLHFAEGDHGIASGIATCIKLSHPYVAACIDGLAGGYLKYGTPTLEYKQLLALCASPVLPQGHADHCFAYGLSRLRVLYSQEKTDAICRGLPLAFQSYCHG